MTPLAPSSLLLPSRSHPRSIETSSISAGTLSNSYIKMNLREDLHSNMRKASGPVQEGEKKLNKSGLCIGRDLRNK
jgi:hypothetical protein